MSKKTLLLDANYVALSFITEKHAFKLLWKSKVDVIASFQERISWGKIVIEHPAILRLKEYIRKSSIGAGFSRPAIIKRDRAICQFCLKKLTPSQITIDHVVPRAKGGENSFTNCVVSCKKCNNFKNDRTPEEAGMVLVRKPFHPSFSFNWCSWDAKDDWHPSWNDFLDR